MKKLLLIDGHSILNRAFFAIPLLSNSKGTHTNAIYGFINIMQKFIDSELPDYLTVAFDVHAPTFRHKMYKEYKGTRKTMADELREQVPIIKNLLKAMDITVVEKEGLEADDILGTLAKRAECEGCEVTIVSGDRDLLQLASKHIKISIPKTSKGQTTVEDYYADDVIEKKGVTPEEFIDVKALWGDTSDNIPGVPGIGEKTATTIIQKYHSVENAYNHCDELKPPRAAANLKEFYEQAILSKDLATIRVDSDVDYDLSLAEYKNIYTKDAYEICKELELKSLLGRFDNAKEEEFFVEELVCSDNDKAHSIIASIIRNNTRVGIHADISSDELNMLYLYDGKVSIVFEKNALGEDFLWEVIYKLYVHTLKKEGRFEFCCLEIKYLLKHLYKKYNLSVDKSLLQISKGFYDLSVISYLLHPLKSEYNISDIAFDALKINISKVNEMAGYVCFAAIDTLLDRLKDEGMHKLYYEIEAPLIFCLLQMEMYGIAADKEALKEYGNKLEVGIKELEKSIFEQANETFNINSPKQLGEVLYEHMGIPGGKKTKTGYSTAADVLEKQANEYPIIKDILSYRQLTKLKSTYADGLSDCIKEDGRIRTTFKQTVTATGRLSSTEPNLQNIPIRVEEGKLIRKVFYPSDGFVFVDADYSQIELRVLAHMSKDERLIEAYKSNQDIHKATAALVFKTPFDEVTSTQRSNAKAVNFGIVYGISSFGLGQDLNITRKEAQKYIDDYFVAYPKLKEYLDDLVSSTKENGYAKTIFGRKRPVPEITSQNFMKRSFGERIAMNSPIQGSAADIIKIAMIRVYDRLLKENLTSRLILQVHDELLIEANEKEADFVKEILVEEMKNACELAVPLEVDVKCGKTWYDAK